MSDKLGLKNIIINNSDNIIVSIADLIDYKIMYEDLDFGEAVIETLEYLQLIMPIYRVSADKEHSNDLMELIRIRYEDYKITRRLGNN